MLPLFWVVKSSALARDLKFHFLSLYFFFMHLLHCKSSRLSLLSSFSFYVNLWCGDLCIISLLWKIAYKLSIHLNTKIRLSQGYNWFNHNLCNSDAWYFVFLLLFIFAISDIYCCVSSITKSVKPRKPWGMSKFKYQNCIYWLCCCITQEQREQRSDLHNINLLRSKNFN